MPTTYEMKLSSDLKEVYRVETLVKAIAAEHHFAPVFLYDVMLIITEATNNAVMHGNKFAPQKNAWLKCEIIADDFYIEVRDEGDGFNPDDVPDPLAEENLLKPSGRGVFLMRQMAKDVRYVFSPAGTTVKILIPIKRDAP
jgi:serine/threonine-protein kinase RsbW